MSKLRDIIGVVDSPEEDPDYRKVVSKEEEAAEEAAEEEAEELDEEAIKDAKDVERTIKACRWPE
eukprot:7433189-Karenia_brevis.AAC.1